MDRKFIIITRCVELQIFLSVRRILYIPLLILCLIFRIWTNQRVLFRDQKMVVRKMIGIVLHLFLVRHMIILGFRNVVAENRNIKENMLLICPLLSKDNELQ